MNSEALKNDQEEEEEEDLATSKKTASKFPRRADPRVSHKEKVHARAKHSSWASSICLFHADLAANNLLLLLRIHEPARGIAGVN